MFWTVCAIATIGILFVIFERLRPYRKEQRVFRIGFVNDLAFYTGLQELILSLILSRVIIAVDEHLPHWRTAFLTDWPIYLQVVFFLLTHDFYIYVTHRLRHKWKWWWRLHEAHHSNVEIDWIAGSRSHFLEVFIDHIFEFFPMIILGASPETPLIKGVISASWGMFIHSNLNVDLGPFTYIFNGPQMHRWHHATDREAWGKNFATKFSLFDWVFGTAYLPKDKVPTGYGLGEGVYFPHNYFKAQAYAFRGNSNVGQAEAQIDYQKE